jgi:hypothetical protein
MSQEPANPTFDSRLTNGTDRFIAHMIEHAFAIGRRTSRDFLRHFPPMTIMEALKDQPLLRADILEAATGVKRRVALKKSAGSSGEDLQIALDEGEAQADDVIRLFRPDDRVRFLPRAKLWSFVVEGDFWNANKTDKAGFERAQQHIAFLLDRGLKDQLLSHQDIIDGISIVKISQLMPRPELEMAMTSALAAGRRGQAFSDRDFYDALTSATIVMHIPLSHLWDEVVYPCIAVEHGLVTTPPSAEKTEEAANAVPEAVKAQVANSNDPQSPARPVSKVLVPATSIKRPGAAAATNAKQSVSPAAAKLPVVSAHEPPSQEEVPCDLDFDDTLTASRN